MTDDRVPVCETFDRLLEDFGLLLGNFRAPAAVLARTAFLDGAQRTLRAAREVKVIAKSAREQAERLLETQRRLSSENRPAPPITKPCSRTPADTEQPRQVSTPDTPKTSSPPLTTSGPLVKRYLGRVRPDKIGITKHFCLPILEVLADRGGTTASRQVHDELERRMGFTFRDLDCQVLPSDGKTPRWRKTAEWAR